MMKLFAVGFLILGLVGCGVVPAKVQYAEYPRTAIGTPANDASGYQFRHRRSAILLEYKSDGFQATPVPYELTPDGSYSTLYRVWGFDDYRSTTQLKVNYVENTKFIDQLQVTTKDNVADTISKIGGVLQAAVPLIASVVAAKEAPTKPFIKTMIDPARTGVHKWTKDPLNEGYCVRLKDVVSESPLSLQQYVTEGLGKWQGTFPVPACAMGVVEIAVASSCDEADANIKFSNLVKFADSDKVLPTGLPSSGLLKMSSVCGASVTEADKQDRNLLLTWLSNAISQIQGISAAWTKAKNDQEKTDKPKSDKDNTEKAGAGK